MSMPMHLHVVVVGEKGGLAEIVAAVLRGDEIGGINPRILAATTWMAREKSMFSLSGNKHKFSINVALPCVFINPKDIHLWIALDAEGEKDARRNIEQNGPAPAGFYRHVFPDPVVKCGFTISPIPSSKDDLDKWFDDLIENLEPWRKRIWEAFSDSS